MGAMPGQGGLCLCVPPILKLLPPAPSLSQNPSPHLPQCSLLQACGGACTAAALHPTPGCPDTSTKESNNHLTSLQATGCKHYPSPCPSQPFIGIPGFPAGSYYCSYYCYLVLKEMGPPALGVSRANPPGPVRVWPWFLSRLSLSPLTLLGACVLWAHKLVYPQGAAPKGTGVSVPAPLQQHPAKGAHAPTPKLASSPQRDAGVMADTKT